MNRVRFFFLLFALLMAARLCHVHILWAEETLPLAAARQMLAGKALYRDIWFDKPPAAPLLCLAVGAGAGWPLRVAGALYALLCCWIAFGFARDLWGEVQIVKLELDPIDLVTQRQQLLLSLQRREGPVGVEIVKARFEDPDHAKTLVAPDRAKRS